MTILRRIKSAWVYASHLPWVERPLWEAEDAANLREFLATPSGQRLAAAMTNLVLRQQERALTDPRHIEYEAGFATGQKAMLVHLTHTWPDEHQFTEAGDNTDADPTTTQ
jgi:hypothetical protein